MFNMVEQALREVIRSVRALTICESETQNVVQTKSFWRIELSIQYCPTQDSLSQLLEW